MDKGPTRATFLRGLRVRVRNRFDRSWASGFEIDDHRATREDGRTRYVVRRLSDGSTLPVAFEEDELAPDL